MHGTTQAVEMHTTYCTTSVWADILPGILLLFEDWSS